MKKQRIKTIFRPLMAATFLSLSFLPAAMADYPGFEKVVSGDLVSQEAKGAGFVDVIVTLSGQRGSTQSSMDEYEVMSSIELQRQVIGRMSTSSGKVVTQLESLPIFSASLTSSGIQELAAMGEVTTIEKNWPVKLSTKQGIPLIGASNIRKSGNGGKGVAIAVVDTGMDYTHPALGGAGFPNSKVIGGYDFGDNDPDPMEGVTMGGDGVSTPSNHGTSCGSIAAGGNTNTEDYIGGVAPEAKLYALKVWDSQGRASLMAILKAWDWSITHQYDDPENPIMIISNSLGNPKLQASNSCDSRFPAWTKMADKVASKGISIFIASGNEGQYNTIAAPSCLSKAISVGAVFDDHFQGHQTRDMVTPYSNSSEILDLLAPSHNAYAPTSPGKGYVPDFGGTSAACPYAAGAAAVLQSEYKKKYDVFMPMEVLRALMVSTGDMILDSRSGLTKPRVNVEKALAAFSSPEKDEDKPDSDDDEIAEPFIEDSSGKYETILDY